MYWFIFSVLSLIFIISPYDRGLYFITDLYGFTITLTVLLLVIIIRLFLYKEQWDMKVVGVAFLMPLCYLLPLPGAVSPQGAGEELIRWTTYFSFFVLLYWVTAKQEIKRWLPFIFQLTGSWISLWMILGALGLIDNKGLFISGRFAGVLQYPNTFAVILGVFFLFSLVMLTDSNLSSKNIVIFSFPLVIYLICFIQTYSRGMLLVLPATWFIGLLFLSFKKQVEYSLFTLIAIIFAFIIYQLHSLSPFLYLLLLALFSMIVIFIVISMKKSRFIVFLNLVTTKDWMIKKYMPLVVPVFIIIIGIAGSLDLKYHGLVYRLLPQVLQERLDSISLQTNTAKERYIFADDAFALSADSPIFGHGGGAWETVYKTYQQSPYTSNKIHNGYLEWLVDTGWVGICLFLIAFGYYIFLMLRKIKEERESTSSLAALMGLVVILTHSLIDFNFSYGTVWFILFFLLAIGLPRQLERKASIQTLHPFVKFITNRGSVILIAFVVFLTGIYSFRSMQAAKWYNHSKETNVIFVKREYLEKAIDLNSSNTIYISSLLDLELEMLKKGEVQSNELKELLLQFIEKEPENGRIFYKAAEVAEEIDENEMAYYFYEKALELDHFNKKLYESSMRFKSIMALKDRLNREFYAQSILSDYKKMIKWDNKLRELHLPEEFNSREFELSNNIYYRAAMAHFILGNFDEVQSLFENSINPDYRLEALAALSWEEEMDVNKAYNVVENSKNKEEVRRLITQLKGIFQK